MKPRSRSLEFDGPIVYVPYGIEATSPKLLEDI